MFYRVLSLNVPSYAESPTTAAQSLIFNLGNSACTLKIVLLESTHKYNGTFGTPIKIRW